jgi:hypothetical protein
VEEGYAPSLMQRSIYAFLVAMAVGVAVYCTSSDEDLLDLVEVVQATEIYERPTPMQANSIPQQTKPQHAIHTDPYAGWQQWCEPLDYDTACKKHDDCREIKHVSRRPLRCVHPYWAKDAPDYKICAPGYSTRTERIWRETRLREIVAQAYFDETKECGGWSWDPVKSSKGNIVRYERLWENRRPSHRQFWKCTREQARAKKLTTFLGVVYGRETGKRPWKRHRLDVEPNEQAWLYQGKSYGWKIEMRCRNGRASCSKSKQVFGAISKDPSATEHNPHYPDRWRWKYGLGGYGKNSPYGTQDWDSMAPPEVLCLEVPGTEAYLRDTRDAVRKYTSGKPPTCDGQPYHGLSRATGDDITHASPSWVDVHRVASGGAWCPRGTKDQQFRARMVRARMDPDEPVTLVMLGRPLPRDQQNQIAARILNRLETVLPPPWTVTQAFGDE